MERFCSESVPDTLYDRPFPVPRSRYHQCKSDFPLAGPIEAELRELSSLWQPARYNRASAAANAFVEPFWARIGLPTGAWAYENMDDAWSEAIEAAEALGL